MYAFRESLEGELEFEFPEGNVVESGTVRAIPAPIARSRDLSVSSSEPTPIGPQLRTEPMSAPEPPSLRMGGARVVSFPPYTTAPPIGLASGAPRDPNATHRPTGDTTPPVVKVAAHNAPTLEGLFSTTVMETLPGFGV